MLMNEAFFARTWCQQEFEAQGFVTQLVQCNVSFNHRRALYEEFITKQIPWRGQVNSLYLWGNL